MEKKPWESKTVWVALVVAIIPFIPGASALISANPDVVGVTLGVVFAALRMITKDKIVIS